MLLTLHSPAPAPGPGQPGVVGVVESGTTGETGLGEAGVVVGGGVTQREGGTDEVGTGVVMGAGVAVAEVTGTDGDSGGGCAAALTSPVRVTATAASATATEAATLRLMRDPRHPRSGAR
ncbi:hypothetical protein [Nocardia asiatica]|uniref:hypothetical protein n=1 Tax=Nocardia asiatica TaxID=209252 RepID=UPI002453CFAD|nr:hypothetical protein [Nocardia asiatica]